MTHLRFRSFVVAISCSLSAVSALAAQVVETRTVDLTQTVTLTGIPEGAKNVRLWVPVPGDAPWQRVLDSHLVSAPGSWRLVEQEGGRGTFVFADVANPPAGSLSVVFRCTVQRQGVHVALDGAQAAGPVQAELFTESLDLDAPLMQADASMRELADKACGDEHDIARQALLLMRYVADNADHYSKDASKPKCGRGSAEDCLEHGGGCCTDLHSLFIALARARGIPARIQFGYRLLDSKAGQSYDPGYRCWVEVFVPGFGWVPEDIVASDGTAKPGPATWPSLSATRVWVWAGRNFELTPPAAAGRINTMTCGWAEIDGRGVDPLPAADGTPSQLTRTVQYEVLARDRAVQDVALPE